jgi:adenylate cyclase
VRRSLPLSALVTGAFLALILATTSVVAWSGLQGARQTVDELWTQIADSIARRTAAEALRFLEPAEPHAHLSAALLEGGTLDPLDHDQLLAYLEESIDAHPAFTWVSWGYAGDGAFLGVYRVGPGQPLHRTVRTQEDAGTHYVVQRRDEGGWVTIEDHTGVRHYDARDRPWYRAAAGRPGGDGTWVDPYLFHNREQPGVSYAIPVHGPSGSLVGVYCVDFEMAPLSRFLATLRIGRTGRAYIVGRDGEVIGHPDGSLVHLTTDGRDLWDAAAHPDPMLSQAWRAWTERGRPGEPYSFGRYLAVASPFGSATVPWTVLTVVPRQELLGHAERQAQRAIAFGALASVLALLLGVALSRGLSRGVTALERELLRTARLDLTDEGDPALGDSPIRELAEMGRATLQMKQGLRAFSRYVPHQLVRQVLASGREARLGAERRELTVLFSDIAGFTTVVESTPPDVVLAALGAYLDGMNEAIALHRGTVCQYLGDGIMAFWGAPEPMADHAARACRGALAMQANAQRLVSEAGDNGHPSLPTRIGLDTGEVMVGNIGASDRFNYGILGDTVNTAARLESLNKQYGTRIVVGARTAELAGDGFLFRPLDRVRVRGKQRPVVVHELLAEADDAGPELLAAVAAWGEAYEAYLERRFVEAKSGFEAFLRLSAGDVPALQLVARCEQYMADPPSPDWDGVHVAD